jgi:hypothetical protein
MIAIIGSLMIVSFILEVGTGLVSSELEIANQQ